MNAARLLAHRGCGPIGGCIAPDLALEWQSSSAKGDRSWGVTALCLSGSPPSPRMALADFDSASRQAHAVTAVTLPLPARRAGGDPLPRRELRACSWLHQLGLSVSQGEKVLVRHPVSPSSLGQVDQRLIERLEREPGKGAVMNGETSFGAKRAMYTHGFVGVDVVVLHEPPRFVVTDRDRCKIESTRAFAHVP